MNKISVLVVLYGKELIESKTLTTLLDSSFKFSSLIIHNNGPKEVFDDNVLLERMRERFDFISIINDINNSPLSKVYNKYIKESEADYFVILDDDTEINSDYLSFLSNEIEKTNFDVIVPKILSLSNEQFYPISNGKPIISYGDISEFSNMLSITSGIIISKSLISKLNCHEKNSVLFDERYSLYGVDTSFFKNINKKNTSNFIKVGHHTYLFHSLSRTEGVDSPFRHRERLYDLAISTRCYPSVINYYYFIKKILSVAYSLDFKLFSDVIRVFLRGRHPKC